MKTESISLRAEMAERVSQLTIHPPNFSTGCMFVHAPCTWTDPIPPFVCKSMRSEVDKWNQLLVPHHFLWLMLGQHGLWQPFVHWRIRRVGSQKAFLISWGSFSPSGELLFVKVKVMFLSYFCMDDVIGLHVGHMLSQEPPDSEALGTVMSKNLHAAPHLCVSWVF